MKKFLPFFLAIALALPVFGQTDPGGIISRLGIKGATDHGGSTNFYKYLPYLDTNGTLSSTLIGAGIQDDTNFAAIYAAVTNITGGADINATLTSRRNYSLSISNSSALYPLRQGNGGSLTNLNASGIASGTLNDARLGINIPRLNADNQHWLGTNIVDAGYLSISNSSTAARIVLNSSDMAYGGSAIFMYDTNASTNPYYVPLMALCASFNGGYEYSMWGGVRGSGSNPQDYRSTIKMFGDPSGNTFLQLQARGIGSGVGYVQLDPGVGGAVYLTGQPGEYVIMAAGSRFRLSGDPYNGSDMPYDFTIRKAAAGLNVRDVVGSQVALVASNSVYGGMPTVVFSNNLDSTGIVVGESNGTMLVVGNLSVTTNTSALFGSGVTIEQYRAGEGGPRLTFNATNGQSAYIELRNTGTPQFQFIGPNGEVMQYQQGSTAFQNNTGYGGFQVTANGQIFLDGRGGANILLYPLISGYVQVLGPTHLDGPVTTAGLTVTNDVSVGPAGSVNPGATFVATNTLCLTPTDFQTNITYFCNGVATNYVVLP